MDPKATLDRIRSAIADRDWTEAREGLSDYWAWRRRGGFQPSGGDKKARALEAKMAAKKKGTLGAAFKSGGAANRRRYSSISSGKPITKRVPKACALVRTTVDGVRRTKIRKGCRITKNGARCDELTRIPAEVYDRKRKVKVSCG